MAYSDREESSELLPECFVIMPISDPDGYESGHFQHVFDDIFRPACQMAGLEAVRADTVRETNLIHLDLLQRLLRSPMVLCDLSTRNPNVLFELGLRQAFDKPVVIVQEIGTPRIFDIAPLRFTEYRRERVYHQVKEDQKSISQVLVATKTASEKGAGINSIVKLLALTEPAALPDIQEANRDPILQIVRAELNDLRNEVRRIALARVDLPTKEPFLPDLERLEGEIALLEFRVVNMEKSGVAEPDFLEELSRVWNALGQRAGLLYRSKDAKTVNSLADRLELLKKSYGKFDASATSE